MILFCLPDDCLAEIYSEWLFLEDLTKLDTAMCNRKKRAEFLRTVSSKRLLFTGKTYNLVNQEYLNWISKRELLVKEVKFSATFIFNNSESFTTKCFNRLELLDVSGVASIPNWLLVMMVSSSPLLNHLNISGCTRIIDQALIDLVEISSKLKILDLSHCKFTDVGIMGAAAASRNLKELYIGGIDMGNCLNDDAVVCIASQCQTVEILELNSCVNLTEISIKQVFVSLTSLKKLSLRNCWSLTELKFGELNPSGILTHLNLSHCENLTDQAVNAIAANISTLTYLNLHRCKRINDPSIAALVGANQSLTQLDISSCRRASDKAITSISERSNLRHLNLTLCTRFTDAALVHLSEHCRALSHLSLKSCRNFTDRAVMAVAQHGALVQLNCNGCENLSDLAVIAVAESCRLLTHIDLSHCKKITDQSISSLASHCHLLSHLNLHKCNRPDRFGCGSITDGAVLNIARRFARLDTTGRGNVVQYINRIMQPPTTQDGDKLF